MATITSAQSGNFNATTTWVGGVVPIDADSFIIANGHTVTYNVATPVTNGFDDSDIFGILQSQSGTSTTLRMNGRLRIRTNGTYHARAGHRLQFRGTAAESHILYQLPEAGASLIMEGSDGMPTTTLSAAANEKSTSFSFTSATNFAAGEWFAIYNNTTAYTGNAGAATLRDEGFWVHDISGNTVFFRQFVGPEATIISASGTSLTVNNAKVFRVNQQIIFGTGANRNVRSITNINYSTNVITINSSVTGTVAGQTIYETGSDKIHASGDKVRKVATVTTASSLSTATTITVANANMFAANDEIWLQARSEAANSTDGNFNAYGTNEGPRYRHVISSVSGNVLTLSAAIGYNVAQGSLVTRLTRDVVVEPVVPNSNYYGVYLQAYTAQYSRKLILKDVQFRYVGSSFGGVERGVTIENTGHFSTNALPVTISNTVPQRNQEPWLEGISVTGSNTTRDLGGLFNGARYGQLRCCTSVGIFNSGIAVWSVSGTASYNSIVSGSNAWGFRCEHSAEWGEIAYNYSSRNFRGFRMIQFDTNLGFHHNIVDANNEVAVYYSVVEYADTYKLKATGSRWGILSERSNVPIFYSQVSRLSGLANKNSNPPGTTARSYFHQGHIDRSHNQTCITFIENDFEYDSIWQENYGSERYWDFSENAWRVLHSTEINDYGLGWFTSVYVPANATLRASCAIKLYTPYSGNYPRFEARSTVSGVTPNQFANAGGQWSSWPSGGASSIQYTAAAEGDYETRELTISPVHFTRYITVGVHVDNLNASEGYWMKPIDIFLDSSYPAEMMRYVNSFSTVGMSNLITSDTFNQNIVRINGGRIK
jgi:hypothetical protein